MATPITWYFRLPATYRRHCRSVWVWYLIEALYSANSILNCPNLNRMTLWPNSQLQRTPWTLSYPMMLRLKKRMTRFRYWRTIGKRIEKSVRRSRRSLTDAKAITWRHLGITDGAETLEDRCLEAQLPPVHPPADAAIREIHALSILIWHRLNHWQTLAPVRKVRVPSGLMKLLRKLMILDESFVWRDSREH